ncbi:NlpC/P60 family protein [Clostridium fermenticellae]|nr:C40 family peptidase [Clostridium fermenticellae]
MIITLLINAAYAKNVLASPSSTQISITNTNKEDDLENKIQIADNEIEKNIDNLNTYNNKIKSLEKNIVKNETNIKNLTTQIQKLNDASKQQIRAMYINGMSEGYIELLLSSKNIIDFADKAIAAQKIISFDKDTLRTLSQNKQNIKLESDKLDSDKKNLEELKNDVNKKIQLLNEQKNSEKALLAQLKDDDSKSLDTTNTDNAIVNYAFKFLGVKYVWGGTSPDPGFDCSGFVQYVYAHFGVSIPRLSQNQQNYGTDITDRSLLKPGDLVFFGRPAYHVGMYIGDNKFIEAPHTGDVVKICALGNYTSARRITN